MSKHTPGPWVTHRYGEYVIPASDAAKKIGGSSNDVKDLAEYAQYICIVREEHRHRKPSEQQANARLIAAAPDLLDALWDMIDSYQYEASSENPALLKARAAIAKATGDGQ